MRRERTQSVWGGHTIEIYCWARSGFVEEDEHQTAGPRPLMYTSGVSPNTSSAQSVLGMNQ
jgi:hypothetical protein